MIHLMINNYCPLWIRTCHQTATAKHVIICIRIIAQMIFVYIKDDL